MSRFHYVLDGIFPPAMGIIMIYAGFALDGPKLFLLAVLFLAVAAFFFYTGSEPSFLMTYRTLYLFTDEDLDGPLEIVALASVEDYKTKGWLKDISITITMKDGSLREMRPMEGAPKENYVRAFITE